MLLEPPPISTIHPVSDRIAVIRGLKVILATDLAELYGVPTKWHFINKSFILSNDSVVLEP